MGSSVAPTPTISFMYVPGPSHKPDSALIPSSISRRLTSGAPSVGSCTYQPRASRLCGAIWLARTGSLPGRSLTGYRRWALTPPFQPSPVPTRGKASGRPSAGLLSAALDVTAGLRCPYGPPPSPGLLARAASVLLSTGPDFALRPHSVRPGAATGRTIPGTTEFYLTVQDESPPRPLLY